MAYVIGDECISCGSCQGECPVGAIAEGDGKFEIDAGTCIDCGTCAGGCPVGAITQEKYKVNLNKKRGNFLSFLLYYNLNWF